MNVKNITPNKEFNIIGNNKHNFSEYLIKTIMIICSSVAIAVTVGIIFSLLFETIHFFQKVSLSEFLFGTKWSPQTALRSDQVAADGSFGAIPLITGTLLISTIAMCIATPLGLFSAIYLSEYASKKTRNIIKPLLEILAGIPTVVYGFFAALTVAPYYKVFRGNCWSKCFIRKRTSCWIDYGHYDYSTYLFAFR
jgi:phosphate transport system permease protein